MRNFKFIGIKFSKLVFSRLGIFRAKKFFKYLEIDFMNLVTEDFYGFNQTYFVLNRDIVALK